MDQPWSRPFRYLVLTFLLIFLLAMIWATREVIAPLMISGLLAFILMPSVDFLNRRTRLPRSIAVALVYFGGLAILIGIPAAMLPILVGETEGLVLSLQAMLKQVETTLTQPIDFLQWEIYLSPLVPDLTDVFSTSLTSLSNNAFILIEEVTRNAMWVLVVLISTYYFLLDWRHLRNWFYSHIPISAQGDAKIIYRKIKNVWWGYLRGNMLLMLIVGVVFTLAWLAIGVPGALILGIIAGLLTIIPDLGPAIAAMLAVIVALIQGSTYLPLSNIWFALLVFGVYMGLINIKNIFIRPRIFGLSVHMHEGIVFVIIIIAVVVEGILGALIVVPIFASAGIVIGYIYRRILNLPPWPELQPPQNTPTPPQ